MGEPMKTEEQPTSHGQENWLSKGLNRARRAMSLKPEESKFATVGGLDIPTDFNARVRDRNQTEAGPVTATPAPKSADILRKTQSEIADEVAQEIAQQVETKSKIKTPLTDKQKKFRNLALKVGIPTVLALGAAGGAVAINELSQNSTISSEQTSGTIEDNNTVELTSSEIKQMLLNQTDGENDLSLFFPYGLPPGTKSSFERTLSERFTGDNDGSLKAEAEKNNIKDNIIQPLPKNTPIRSPANGHIMIAKGKEEWGEDPNKASWIRVFEYNEKEDITYVYWFFDITDQNKKFFFDPLKSMQENAPGIWRGTNYEDLPIVKLGEDLAKTTDNQTVQLNVKGYRGKKVGPEAEIIDETFFPVNLHYLTTVDSDGVERVIVQKDKT